MRIILRCNRYTPIRLMLDALQWLTVEKRIKYLTLTFIYKLLKGYLPNYLFRQVVINHNIHSYETRGRDDVYVTRTNCKSTMKYMMFKGFVDYNKLPRDVKDSQSVTLFRRRLLAVL